MEKQNTEVFNHLPKVTQLLRAEPCWEGDSLVPGPELFSLPFTASEHPFVFHIPFLTNDSGYFYAHFLSSFLQLYVGLHFGPWCGLSCAFSSWEALHSCSFFWKNFSQSNRQPGKHCAGSTGWVFAHGAQAGNKAWKMISDSITSNDLDSLALAWKRGTVPKQYFWKTKFWQNRNWHCLPSVESMFRL